MLMMKFKYKTSAKLIGLVGFSKKKEQTRPDGRVMSGFFTLF